MLNKPLAFLKKDFLSESSYNLAFVFNIFGILINILAYFFIDKLFGGRMVPHLEDFGVNYFSYVMLSMAFFGYVGVGLGSFSERIRAEQMQGTLEAVLLTPTKISTILLSLALWNFAVATVDLAVYAFLAVFLFKINFANMNIVSAAIVFLLTILSFSGLGMISACFIMIFKRGNPFGWIVASVEGLISGVYFPITVMPSWLQAVAHFFPVTYAIKAIELAVYKGYNVFQLSKEIAVLLVFIAVLLPLGLYLFRFGIDRARRDGSLIQY